MKYADFMRVVKLAASPDFSYELSDLDALFGCGLPEFERRPVSLQCAAAHVAYQCRFLSGNGWDSEALAETQAIFRRKVDLLD